MGSFSGEIKGKIVDVRFATSGKIVSVVKKVGDTVTKWGILASLDRKMLQAELDRQLADYDKTRADFDGFAKKYPDPQDENKYTKAEKQAALNASVKDVELAKARLDQCDLFSPIEGIIIDDSGIVPGLYVTPASASIKIIDTNSYYFEFKIEQKDIKEFSQIKKGKIDIDGVGEFEVETQNVFSDGKNLIVKMPIPNASSILLGLQGKVKF